MTPHTLAAETCMNTEYSHYSIFIPNALSAGRHSTLHVHDLPYRQKISYYAPNVLFSLKRSIHIFWKAHSLGRVWQAWRIPTLSTLYAPPPSQLTGQGCHPAPHIFFRDSTEHVDDREQNLNIPDLWFNSNLVTSTAFPGQVRSLTMTS